MKANVSSVSKGMTTLRALSILALCFTFLEPALAAKGGRGKGGGGGGGGGGDLCKVTSEIDIAIYVGGGIGPSSQMWAEALIEFWKTGLRQPGQPGLLNENEDGRTTWGGRCQP